ncbi:tetratricopeptide repeat protein [Reichenbachiella ulvae]|uniref:Tetratricopeptide repeat-containing protein n=1 Tax=Reichenbachiella ulvae TaxID=2980104 RepID=A0ABT3CTN4_9BACT|nr:hypothetical protein [Reichenbachiella ulvae]MCV9387033.1 hypothetical protein [Reichenbachiella ulvae]
MIKLLTIWLLLGLGTGDNDISKINSLKKQGEEAYKAKKYVDALMTFSMLVDSMGVEDEGVIMNLAHCYARIDQKDKAERHYQKLILSKDKQTQSIAYQQLGALSNNPNTLEKALSFFKSALKADPTNEDARYNYELIKKKLDQQKDQNQDQNQDNQDQQNEDENKEDQDQQDQEDQQQGDDQKQENQEGQENQENQENQDQQDQKSKQDQEGKEGEDQQEQQQEGEQGEEGEQKEQQQQQGEQGEKEEAKEQQQSQQQDGEKGEEDEKGQNMSSTSQKLEEMNISEEKAQMILEALKNSEIQYIQQNRRKPTQKQDNGKPDW